MPTWRFLTFQDANRPTIEQLIFFHDHTIVILTIIIISISYVIIRILIIKKFDITFMERQEIERIWTITPALALILIAFPSIKILYLIEDTKDTTLTIKVIGHQWYWSYENNIEKEDNEIDAFIEERNIIRLLKCSESIKIPTHLTSQAIVRSADVIHSWTVPTINIKVDAIPGRLNQVFLTPKRSGIFTGQCSEICGINHSFIPIIIKSIPINKMI